MKRVMQQWPAAAIATIALAIVVTGQALAGPSASNPGVTPAQVRQIAKTVANAQITARAPSLSVASAKTAGSPTMYAQVTAAGVVTGNSLGITQANVVHPRTGFYCFVGLRTAPKGGVGILDAIAPTGFSGPNQIQVGAGAHPRCPDGAQALVATFDPVKGFVDEPFMVMFWS